MARTKREKWLRTLGDAAEKGMAEVSPLSRMELDLEDDALRLKQEAIRGPPLEARSVDHGSGQATRAPETANFAKATCSSF
ncbi:MAG: hypothetical protein ACKVPX_09745 [Myxococcaceae bacterium]